MEGKWEVLGLRRMLWHSGRCHPNLAGTLLLRCFSSSRGMCLKASNYSPPKTSSLNMHSVLLKETSLEGMGVNGSCASSSSRRGFLLDGIEDEYQGFVINPDRLPLNPSVFAAMLQTSLTHWKLKGIKGVWLKLPLERSELVPVAVKKGFEYHHAEPKYVMMTCWIPEGPSMLPANASHQVGIGGFVMNTNNEVLVVQEKHCTSTFKGAWKLPTGFILESEEIYDGAVREVREETGIDTEFVEVIAFRHAHQVAFEKSDLFFVCMLKPLTTKIKVDNMEVQAAMWMPLVEFVQQQFIQGDDMFGKIMDICLARLRKRYCGLSAHHVISKFDGKASSLYYNVAEDDHDFNCLAN